MRISRVRRQEQRSQGLIDITETYHHFYIEKAVTCTAIGIIPVATWAGPE